MTQTELAEKLHISLRTYQRIEYGQQKPNVYVVILLQKIFQKDIEQIIKTNEMIKNDVQEVKQMLEREVIGIDHGNRNMKTVHTDFSAAITKLEVRPDNLENVLEFQGQCFKIGEGAPELETVDKTQNMNYYYLTLAALAEELHYRGKTEALVRIGAALPPRRYGLQKNDFKKYLLQSKRLNFRYEGRNYHIEIENAHIFMQGHVIVLLHQEELMGECVLCDMGGGTNDIMGLIDGKPTGQLFIDKNAALNCINHIREVVEAKTGESISTYALEKFMVNGDYDCSDAYRNIIQGELKQYAIS